MQNCMLHGVLRSPLTLWAVVCLPSFNTHRSARSGPPTSPRICGDRHLQSRISRRTQVAGCRQLTGGRRGGGEPARCAAQRGRGGDWVGASQARPVRSGAQPQSASERNERRRVGVGRTVFLVVRILDCPSYVVLASARACLPLASRSRSSLCWPVRRCPAPAASRLLPYASAGQRQRDRWTARCRRMIA